MSLFFVSLAAAAAAAAPNAAALAGIGITGKTAAPDIAVARAALGEAGAFASGHTLKCGDMGAVQASLMPKRWVPADPNFVLGPKGARYERWDIKLCGKTEAFLVVFWTDKGRSDFQVAYPFPADPAKPAKP